MINNIEEINKYKEYRRIGKDECYTIEYIEEEKDDKIIIKAEMIIEKNTKNGKELIKECEKIMMSPLTRELWNNDNERMRQYKDDNNL